VRPHDISVDGGGRFVVMCRAVDARLLRGDGLDVSRYLPWVLGLRVAPRSRDFRVPGNGEIQVRREIQGGRVSSLRRFALELRAGLGCRLEVRFDTEEDVATVRLAAEQHAQPSRPGRMDLDEDERR
jgi:hypothetical protein